MSQPFALPGWLEAFFPPPTVLTYRQRLIMVVGVFIGIGLTALLCGLLQTHFDLKWWLMAPLGASAAQVFAVPGSPMSQPWPIIGGHALSALAGVLAFHLFGHTALAAGAGVALASAFMIMTRSLHPSGGGTALFMVISQTGDYAFILFPVIVNATVLVSVAIAYHRLTGHSYPQRQRAAPPHVLALHRFDPSDLEAALMGYDQALDISREDVEKLIEQTEMQAYHRLAAAMTCGQIMTTKLRTLTPKTQLSTALAAMSRYDIKAMPVIDADRKLLGLLRLDDALKKDASLPAEDVMRQTYATARADAPATELLTILAKGDRRHVLIVDEEGRLEGLVSKSDLMGALFHAG